MQNQTLDFSLVDKSIPSDWITTHQLVKENSNLPEETTRHLVRNRKSNGLAPACKRIGKFMYTNRKAFAYWLVNV